MSEGGLSFSVTNFQVTDPENPQQMSPWGETQLIFENPTNPTETYILTIIHERKNGRARFKGVKH